MRRVAFFVEGLTECLFIESLFSVVCTRQHLAIHLSKGSGGKKKAITFSTIRADDANNQTKFYVLIVDCSGEGNIRSYIDERRERLADAGYEKIVGIRDVYPTFRRTEIHTLLYGLRFRLPQKPIPVVFILGIMEVEAWLLSEHTHFQKINKSLSLTSIKQALGFDPQIDDMELRDCPAEDLDSIYRLVGLKYKKEEACIKRTIAALDFTEVYFNARPSTLISLMKEVEQFVS